MFAIAFVTFISIANFVTGAANKKLIKDCDSSPNSSCLPELPATCPSWSYCNSTGNCQCYQHNYVISCDHTEDRGGILTCHCLTFNDFTKQTEEGGCPYNCRFYHRSYFGLNQLYTTLPKDVVELNEGMCGKYRRTGTLCGKCIDNTYVRAYSYNMTCIPCEKGWEDVLKYCAVAFLPLSFFYILVLLLSINLHSSELQGTVLINQFLSLPLVVRLTILASKQNSPLYRAFQLLEVFYGIWTLDFFRLYDYNICFHISSLATLSLDYIVAVYPIFLVFVTYLLTIFFSRIKKPYLLNHCFECFTRCLQKNWNIKHSLLHTFITFYMLSCMKIFNVSIDLLIPVKVYNLKQSSQRLALYYDSSVSYFGIEHLPYALLAISMSMLFVILPVVILMMYPFAVFQHFVNKLPNQWQIKFRLVVDSVQGCYKDGTELTSRDWRWYAGMPIALRFLFMMLLAVVFNSVAVLWLVILFVLVVILTLAVEPYKRKFRSLTFHVAISYLFLSWLLMLAIGNEYAFQYQSEALLHLFQSILVSLIISHFLYTLILIYKNYLKPLCFQRRH